MPVVQLPPVMPLGRLFADGQMLVFLLSGVLLDPMVGPVLHRAEPAALVAVARGICFFAGLFQIFVAHSPAFHSILPLPFEVVMPLPPARERILLLLLGCEGVFHRVL